MTLEALCDFHTHTSLSDGVLSPVELVRRAHVRGYRAIGLTDHAGEGELEWLLEGLDIREAHERLEYRTVV